MGWFSKAPKEKRFRGEDALQFYIKHFSRNRRKGMPWIWRMYLTETGIVIGKVWKRKYEFSQIIRATQVGDGLFALGAEITMRSGKKFYISFIRSAQKEEFFEYLHELAGSSISFSSKY